MPYTPLIKYAGFEPIEEPFPFIRNKTLSTMELEARAKDLLAAGKFHAAWELVASLSHTLACKFAKKYGIRNPELKSDLLSAAMAAQYESLVKLAPQKFSMPKLNSKVEDALKNWHNHLPMIRVPQRTLNDWKKKSRAMTLFQDGFKVPQFSEIAGSSETSVSGTGHSGKTVNLIVGREAGATKFYSTIVSQAGRWEITGIDLAGRGTIEFTAMSVDAADKTIVAGRFILDDTSEK